MRIHRHYPTMLQLPHQELAIKMSPMLSLPLKKTINSIKQDICATIGAHVSEMSRHRLLLPHCRPQRRRYERPGD